MLAIREKMWNCEIEWGISRKFQFYSSWIAREAKSYNDEYNLKRKIKDYPRISIISDANEDVGIKYKGQSQSNWKKPQGRNPYIQQHYVEINSSIPEKA